MVAIFAKCKNKVGRDLAMTFLYYKPLVLERGRESNANS
jgi:hypothetical protein